MARRSLSAFLFVLLLCLAQAASTVSRAPELQCGCEAETASVERLAEHEEEVVSEDAADDDALAARRWHAEDDALRLSLLPHEIGHVPRG